MRDKSSMGKLSLSYLTSRALIINFLSVQIQFQFTCVTVVERSGPVAVRHFDAVSFGVEFCT